MSAYAANCQAFATTDANGAITEWERLKRIGKDFLDSTIAASVWWSALTPSSNDGPASGW